MDSSRAFGYDNDNGTNEFVVMGASQDDVFTRRHKDDGTKTRFCTRDFAHIIEVVASLRKYSTREVKQMDKAKQLVQRSEREWRRAWTDGRET